MSPFLGEVKLRGPPVPDGDLSSLMHSCAGPDCTFCAWRKDNPIELGWERLLDPEEAAATTVCRVDLTTSQLLDPSSELSTQQTTDFLANFTDDLYFPRLDAEFENILTQAEASTSQAKPASTCSSVPVTASTRRVYASPKGREAVKCARAASIPTKTKEQSGL